MFQQLGDFALTYSGTTGTIGASCAPATPCIAGVGYGAYSFTAAATVTASGSGNDTYYVYVNSGGTLMVGYGGSTAPSCSGCTAMAGVTGYASGVAAIGRFTISGGQIVASVSDRAAITGPPTLVAGNNITISTAGNTVTINSTGGSGSLPSTVVQTNQSNAYTTGTQDFRSASHTLPSATGASAAKPSTCTVGEQYFATDAAAGQNLYLCTGTNNWNQLSAGSGGNSYDPFNRTILFQEQMLQGAWSAVSFWGGNGGTCGGVGTYAAGVSAGEPAAVEWTTNSGNVCFFYAPFFNSGSGYPLGEFASGSSPLPWELYYDFGVIDQRQNEYVGLSSSVSGDATFAGIRFNVSNGHFECVIRSGNSDVAVTNMAVTYSANVMAYQLSNGGGMTNSITCQVGSTPAVTTAGTMPAGLTYLIAGADWSTGTGIQPHFATGEARFKISGRSATN
jgi:hypothetical protein